MGITAKKEEKKHLLSHEETLDLIQKVQNGDEEAKAALAGLYDALATGIFNCLVSFNPDLVGIGGGISVRPDLVSELDKRIQKLIHDTEASELTYELKSCQFKNDANLLGAASNFLNTK